MSARIICDFRSDPSPSLAAIDPKLVADQLGHGLGVHLDVYTVAALDQRQEAIEVLEASLVNP